MPLAVIPAQTVTVAFDGIQDAHKPGAVPDPGQFAAQHLKRIDVRPASGKAFPGKVNLGMHPGSEGFTVHITNIDPACCEIF